MPKRIMIVDDAEYMIEILGDIIEACGAPDKCKIVGVATNGEDAIKKYRELMDAGLRPDIVTMDIVMPKMDGIAVIKELKKHDKDVRVLAISALDSPDTIDRVMQAGAKDYIIKPFSMDDLMDKIRYVSTCEAETTNEGVSFTRENVIPGTIVSSDGGYAVITVRNAAIEAMSDYGLDERVKLHIDPDNIELHTKPVTRGNQLEGTVLEIIRSDPVSQVKLDCGFELSVNMPSKTLSDNASVDAGSVMRLAVGDHVYAAFSVLSVRVTR